MRAFTTYGQYGRRKPLGFERLDMQKPFWRTHTNRCLSGCTIWGEIWPTLSHLGTHPGNSEGSSWGRLGGSWGHLGLSWGNLAPWSGCLGAILGRLGRSWGHLGAISGRLGASWGHLGPSWGHLGPSWAVLGPSWAVLGLVLGFLRHSWEASGTQKPEKPIGFL